MDDSLLPNDDGDTLEVPKPPAPPPSSTFNSSSWDAALKWLAKGGAGRKPCTLSPMDEMMWFQNVKVSTVRLVGDTWQQACGIDSMRVVLIFSTTTNAQVRLSTNQNATQGTDEPGMNLLNTMLPMIFTQAAHGPLAQVSWYAVGVGTPEDNILTVTEVLLKQWPTTSKP